MLTYICFAKWFGVVSLCLSLGILFNLDDARDMARNMIKEESGYIMGGVQPIIFGSLAFTCHHNFTMGWHLVVTFIGLMMLFAGLYRVLFVKHWKKILRLHADKIPPLFALFGLMFGLLLIYVGYISPLIQYELVASAL